MGANSDAPAPVDANASAARGADAAEFRHVAEILGRGRIGVDLRVARITIEAREGRYPQRKHSTSHPPTKPIAPQIVRATLFQILHSSLIQYH